MWEQIRIHRTNAALSQFGLRLPHSVEASSDDLPALNKPLQRVLSEYVRRTKISRSRFVELVRGQTAEDYRPNKHMLQELLHSACEGYQHREALLDIALYGARVPLLAPLQVQSSYPAIHKSTINRYAVLVHNVCKEQDHWRCLAFDQNILEIWTEVHISPFGVVGKATRSSQREGAEVKLQAGDVASAFRNICTRSYCAYLFGGRFAPDNALVIDLAALFGWSGSPATYWIVGDAIAFTHGLLSNPFQPRGLFNYYWVDVHINVATDVGSTCADAYISLRNTMTTVLGDEAIKEDKFTPWSTRQKTLGLIFDTVAQIVSIPQSEIDKTQACVAAAYAADSPSHSGYSSLLGRLRHVATCVRFARPFLQRLRAQEHHLHHWLRIPVVAEMKHDLVWWTYILRPPLLNGVPMPMAHFRSDPPPDIVVEMDASDSGLCVLVPVPQEVHCYPFRQEEADLIRATKVQP